MLLFRHDKAAIVSELEFLTENYGADYNALSGLLLQAQIAQITSDFSQVLRDYREITSGIILIRRYDTEFLYASVRLIELLAQAEEATGQE